MTDTGWITAEVREFVAKDLDHHHIAEPAAVAEVRTGSKALIPDTWIAPCWTKP